MSKFIKLAQTLSPEVYQRLLKAVETGKWPDSKNLTNRQKDETLQLVLAYQSLHNTNPEHFTISTSGEIHLESKQALKKQFTDKNNIHLVNL